VGRPAGRSTMSRPCRPRRQGPSADVLACIGLVVVTLLLAGIVIAFAAALLAVSALRVRRAGKAATEQARRAAAWRTAFDQLAAAFSSGYGLVGALDVAARALPVPRLAMAARHAQLGGDPVDVLATDPDPRARQLAVSLGTATALGIAPRRILADLSDGVAVQEQVRREVALAMSVARATTRLLAALPCAGIALAELLDAHSVAFLFDRPLGRGCVLVAAILEAIGLWWVQRITDRAG